MTRFLIQFFIIGPLTVFAIIFFSFIIVSFFALNTQMKEEIEESKEKK